MKKSNRETKQLENSDIHEKDSLADYRLILERISSAENRLSVLERDVSKLIENDSQAFQTTIYDFIGGCAKRDDQQ